MTITSETTKSPIYTANGATTSFATGFKILANPETGDAEITVYQLDGTTETVVDPEDYTVTGVGLDGGGAFVFAIAPASGLKYRAKSSVEKTQGVDLINQGPVFRETYEVMVDRAVRMVQEQQEAIDRAVKVSITSADSPEDLMQDLLDASTAAIAAEGGAQDAQAAAEAVLDDAGFIAVSDDLTGDDTIGDVAAIASDVTTVAGIASDVSDVASNATDVSTVATNIADVNTCADNIAAIIDAPNQAQDAIDARIAAEAALASTLSAYDNFDDRYLGAKASDPTLDNDGNALVAGSLYFNTGDASMKVYTGSVWVAAYVSGTDFLAKANNLSDLTNATTARTNLGLAGLATLATVGTSQIDNNAVNGSKIAMGSDAAGDMLYYNGTDYVRLPKGTALQQLRINAGATAPEWATSTIPTLAEGTFTPTITNVANTTVGTVHQHRYTRIGNTITISGAVNVTPASATTCQIGVTLPVASAFTANINAAGVSVTVGKTPGLVYADEVNDRMQVEWLAPNTTATAIYYFAVYTVM